MTPGALLLQGLALGFTAAVSPGPFQTYLITQTLAGGWRRGALVALAPLLSDAPIVLLSLLLLQNLPPVFLHVLSLAGGLFVLWVAWGLWKSWRVSAGAAQASAPGAPEAAAVSMPGLGRAVLMNALSPGPWTFWALVAGPLLLGALRQSAYHGASFLLGFYGAMLGSLLCLALLFHQARRLDPPLVRLLQLISVGILVGFGVLLLWRGLLP